MAKRLTDTEKWKDEWYISLTNDYRALWQYMLDNCSHSGIFKKGFDLMNFCCHTTITKTDFNIVFKGRVVDCGTYYFIPKFVHFQYGNDFTSKRPVIVSVIKDLKERGLFEMINKSLYNDCQIIKSKRTDKRTAKSKRMEGIVKGNQPFQPIPKEAQVEIDKILGRTK